MAVEVPNATDEAMQRFLEQCHRRTYPAKTVIVNAGDPSEELFYIIKGSVSVIMEDDDGHEIVLAYLNEGDFFGEIGMFDEKHERSALVRTRTECEVAQISYDRLKAIAPELPEVLYAMMSQLALRLRNTSRKVGDLAFMDVSGRVARALLDLCKQPDAMTHPDGMQIRITRQELGRIAGCSREMVGRVLKNLEEEHLISVAGKTIVVFGTR
ncbi:MAG: cAMP-activated global transcriptional regulator CRP [Gammaproteobacteria bacterium]|nr:cAMP-activated global transcriptional regulator CRP [Gammaproteobacteria bacterium]